MITTLEKFLNENVNGEDRVVPLLGKHTKKYVRDMVRGWLVSKGLNLLEMYLFLQYVNWRYMLEYPKIHEINTPEKYLPTKKVSYIKDQRIVELLGEPKLRQWNPCKLTNFAIELDKEFQEKFQPQNIEPKDRRLVWDAIRNIGTDSKYL